MLGANSRRNRPIGPTVDPMAQQRDLTEGLRSNSSSSADARSAVGLLALQALPRVGPKTALKLAFAGIEIEAVLGPKLDEWRDKLLPAAALIETYRAAGIDLLTFFDDRYPARLRTLHDPPPILYVRGRVEALSETRSIAVIGTREPTDFGKTATRAVCEQLASDRWTIVSGLAKGIDTLAHDAALTYHTPTVAVLGGGLDRIYPAVNKSLANAILEHGGALVSEQPWGTQPRAGQLIARNRLQTGLSAAVVVVQSATKGGSMHTARHAAIQGRPIFCPVPHSHHERSSGIRALLELPGRELCTVLPAWRDSPSLCRRLNGRPIAHPIHSADMTTLIDELHQVLEENPMDSNLRWWPPSASAYSTGVAVTARQSDALFHLDD
jgi:DNA processing protein